MILYFFIGTEAELIKVFPIMIRAKERGIDYRIIASGQNDIAKSRVMRFANEGRIDLQLSEEKNITKTSSGLLKWYLSTTKLAKREVADKLLKGWNASDACMIVHGDTVSTVMGAYTGKKLGMKVAHIEAGLRSHHWFNPFPEEIDRMLVSRVASFHFAPGEEAAKNLKGKIGVFNTGINTLYESYQYALKQECQNSIIEELQGEDYFVLVVHRQENVSNTELMKQIIGKAEAVSKQHRCVLVLHKITEIKLQEMGLLDQIKQDAGFVTVPRMDYFDFMKLLKGSQFVITDGGSNQEELSYMGKPALILRKNTERDEGIGENAVLYHGDPYEIDQFVDHFQDYKRDEVVSQDRVADNILNKLEEQYHSLTI